MANRVPNPIDSGRAFAVLCWATALASFCLPVSNPDIFWHLSAARRMVAVGAIPRADWLSFTMEGRPWLDFEWLCQLVWYGTLKGIGPWGLVALKASLFSVGAACLWGATRLYRLDLKLSALAVLAWGVGLAPSNDLRPENLSLALFSAEFLWLEALRLERVRPSPRAAAAAAGAFVLWANWHPGFLYGLALLALYAAAEWRRRGRLFLAGAVLACAAATLLNPFGFHLYTVAFEHAQAMGDLQRYIREWQEPSILSPWLAVFWLAVPAAFLGLLAGLLARKDAPPEHLIAVAAFAVSASRHVRTAPYFLAVAIPISLGQLSAWDWGGERGRRLGKWLAAAAAALMLGFFCRMMLPELLKRRAFLPRFVPDEVAGFLDKERLVLGPRKMLNPWHWGGYIGYELSPDYKVFVDGRYIFHSLLAPAHSAAESPEAYRALLDTFGIDVVLQERTHQFRPMPVELPGGKKDMLLRPFYLFFLPKPDWALVYWGHQGLVFVRRAAFDKAWIAPREFRYVRPDDLRTAEIMVKQRLVPRGEVAAEVERFLRLNPGIPETAALRAWAAGLRP
ncbi:MAG: hypothetical protein HY078_00825 [Elusimicrobia bacterium]|nr:hypothetical protein [Elusimicrobiota bacterium]